MSDRNPSRLERHARLLVRAYPPAYRAGRGEEIIGTLLEATPRGRSWPPAYEVASVISGGLRARRAANLRQGLTTSLRQAAILAAAVYLVQLPCQTLIEFVQLARMGLIPLQFGSFAWSNYLSSALAMLIIAAVWSGRRQLIIVAAVATAIPPTIHLLISHEWDGMVTMAAYVGPALAVVVPLARRAERPPRPLLWLLCLSVGVVLAEALSSPHLQMASFETLSQTMLLFPYTTYLSLVTVGVAACWLVTDVRPLTGLILSFTVTRVIFGIAYGRSSLAAGPVQLAIAIAAPFALVCALVWLLRHRTRTFPPTPN